MPYFLTTDQHADDPVWEVLGGGKPALVDALKASYIDLNAKAAHLLTNGYLTRETALRYCRGRRKVLELLTAAVLDRAPLLHRRTDECACLGDEEWIDGYDYRIHKFLKRNPSRREYERNRAQKADLRDARLKALVSDRDGGCCRYCRSGPLSPKAGRSKDRRKVLSYDHVDPDRPAGPDGEGLVVACGRCNEHKGHRTPDEADMVLLPVPTAAEKATWAARGPALFDLSTDHRPITDRSPTKQRTVTDPNTDPVTDRNSDPNADRHDNSPADVCPDHAEHDHDQARGWSAKGPGRVGQRPFTDTGPPRPAAPPGQPARRPDAPDIYHRRSRSPTSQPPPEGSPT